MSTSVMAPGISAALAGETTTTPPSDGGDQRCEQHSDLAEQRHGVSCEVPRWEECLIGGNDPLSIGTGTAVQTTQYPHEREVDHIGNTRDLSEISRTGC